MDHDSNVPWSTYQLGTSLVGIAYDDREGCGRDPLPAGVQRRGRFIEGDLRAAVTTQPDSAFCRGPRRT